MVFLAGRDGRREEEGSGVVSFPLFAVRLSGRSEEKDGFSFVMDVGGGEGWKGKILFLPSSPERVRERHILRRRRRKRPRRRHAIDQTDKSSLGGDFLLRRSKRVILSGFCYNHAAGNRILRRVDGIPPKGACASNGWAEEKERLTDENALLPCTSY